MNRILFICFHRRHWFMDDAVREFCQADLQIENIQRVKTTISGYGEAFCAKLTNGIEICKAHSDPKNPSEGQTIEYLFDSPDEINDRNKDLKMPIIEQFGFLRPLRLMPPMIHVLNVFGSGGSLAGKQVTVTTY